MHESCKIDIVVGGVYWEEGVGIIDIKVIESSMDVAEFVSFPMEYMYKVESVVVEVYVRGFISLG